MTVVIRSPAKLNCGLAVYPPDQSGYHPIASQFVRLAYSDILYIRPCKTRHLKLSAAGLTGSNQANTVSRSYAFIADRLSHGLHVVIRKRIPLGAGLGGGSSNAGVFLRVVNTVYQLGYTDHELQAIARQVGSDVPFFLANYTRAWVTGYGDQLTCLSNQEPVHYVLIMIQSMPTPLIYNLYDTRGVYTTTPVTPSYQANDFEPIISKHYPAYQALMQAWQYHYPDNVLRLSGSGGCVFAAFSDYRTARQALSFSRQRWPNYWIQQTQAV